MKSLKKYISTIILLLFSLSIFAKKLVVCYYMNAEWHCMIIYTDKGCDEWSWHYADGTPVPDEHVTCDEIEGVYTINSGDGSGGGGGNGNCLEVLIYDSGDIFQVDGEDTIFNSTVSLEQNLVEVLYDENCNLVITETTLEDYKVYYGYSSSSRKGGEEAIYLLPTKGDLSIKVSPNPASDILILNLESNEEIFRHAIFELFDVFGKKIMSIEVDAGETLIKINEIPEGIYIYNIVLDLLPSNLILDGKISIKH